MRQTTFKADPIPELGPDEEEWDMWATGKIDRLTVLLEVCEGILMFPDVRNHISSKFPGLIKQIEESVRKAKE